MQIGNSAAIIGSDPKSLVLSSIYTKPSSYVTPQLYKCSEMVGRHAQTSEQTGKKKQTNRIYTHQHGASNAKTPHQQPQYHRDHDVVITASEDRFGGARSGRRQNRLDQSPDPEMCGEDCPIG